MLRYEIEKQLLTAELAVRDLPEAWKAGMEQEVGNPAGERHGGCRRTSTGLSGRSVLSVVRTRRGHRAQLYESLRRMFPALMSNSLARVLGLLDWLRPTS